MNSLKTIKRAGALILAILFFNTVSYGATYTAAVSGNWSSSTTWGGTAPSFTNTADQIIIPALITVAMDDNVTLNGSTSTLAVAGTLTGATGNYLTVTEGAITGIGSIATGYVTMGTGATIAFTGTIATDYYSNTSSATLKSYANVIVAKSMTLTSGALSIESGGVLAFTTGATIIMAGGQLVANSGTITLTSSYNVAYSAAATTGAELSGIGLTNLTINVPSTSAVTLNSDLVVKGTLTLTSGVLALGSRNLKIAGDIASSGSGTVASTSANDINFATTSSITGVLNFSGNSNVVNNLTVAVGNANHAQIGGNLAVVGSLTLTSGALNLSNGSNFTLSGDVAAAGTGKLAPSPTSNITINTAISPTGSIGFASGNNTVNNLTVNIGNGGTFKLDTINSDLTVAGTLTITKGLINIGNDTLTIGSAGSISGAGSASYIITGTGGFLAMTLAAGASNASTFPIGTSTNYFPAAIILNSSSASGTVMVNATPNVHGHGLVGNLISTLQPVVDATWDIRSSITSNMNMKMNLMWPTTAEVNAFDRTKAYIAHFTNNAWDVNTTASATTVATGMYGISRDNIASLSPFAVFDQATSGVNESNNISLENSFGLFPNPASDNIYVTSPANMTGTTYIEIHSINGQLMVSSTMNGNNQAINVSALAPGCYFVKLYNGTSAMTQKFIKI